MNGPEQKRSGTAPDDDRGPLRRRRAVSRSKTTASSLLAQGEPMLWLTGGALGIALVMIVGLLGLVLYQGTGTFWPVSVVRVETIDGRELVGEVTRDESFRPGEELLAGLPAGIATNARVRLGESGGVAHRRLVRTGNFDLSGSHFDWVSDFEVRSEERPEWVLVVERTSWGRFYGTPLAFLVDDIAQAEGPEESWRRYREWIGAVTERREEIRHLETDEIGRINAREERHRLAVRSAELEHGPDSDEYRRAVIEHRMIEQQAQLEYEKIQREIEALRRENGRYALRMSTTSGETALALSDIVRAYPANRLGLLDRVGVYLDRWREFLVAEPREANSEGGVWPAIFGTVVMTLLMTIVVVPFGVLAALYLREYARSGLVVSTVRIAINNLAGVPSIVFGVFGLGFFSYTIGTSIDQLLFSARLPNPTYGTGGVLWASLTLALLTLPVVIVATEEALAAVPGSMREGSYACGASKWQTIRRIVLPKALPGIMTGAILAMARGAGEVAPLMLVGAVKLAPDLPIDGIFPYIHPQRSFMHLGFHIYDLGFQSQNSEAAKPMVFTTTLLLITIIFVLNLSAIWLRKRLRQRFESNQF